MFKEFGIFHIEVFVISEENAHSSRNNWKLVCWYFQKRDGSIIIIFLMQFEMNNTGKNLPDSVLDVT